MGLFPKMNKNELTMVTKKHKVSCFYGTELETEKQAAINKVQDRMRGFSSFESGYIPRVFAKTKGKTWSYSGNIMVYENREVTDNRRVLTDGLGEYECIVWLTAIVAT